MESRLCVRPRGRLNSGVGLRLMATSQFNNLHCKEKEAGMARL